jgi:hypothetical protein
VVDHRPYRRQQLAQGLQVLLVRDGLPPQQLDDAHVHDLLREQALLVELADEADVAQKALPDLLPLLCTPGEKTSSSTRKILFLLLEIKAVYHKRHKNFLP